MRARKTDAEPLRFESGGYRGSDWTGRFKNNEMRNGAGGRRTAEGTVLKMRMGFVMVMIRRHRHRGCRRTQFQQKRRPARRHEADGDISSEQQQRQQYAGQ